MSTLSVSQLQNTASPQPNISLNADGSSTLAVVSGPTAPSVTLPGTLWFNTTTAQLQVRNTANTGWVSAGGGATSGTTAPTSPAIGDQWVDTNSNPPVLKIWNGSTWVPASVSISNAVPPVGPVIGQLWSDTSTTPSTLKAWNGSAWVPVQAAGGGAGTVTSVSGTAPIVVATGTTTPAISITAATTGALGAVQVGTNIYVAAGVISVEDASATDKGVIEIATLAEASTGTSALLASTPSTSVPKTPADMTGAALIPGGNDAARPAPVTGMFRYNNQAGTPAVMEFYDGANWSAYQDWVLTGSNLAPANPAATNLQFNSGYGSNATAYGCRAWVNFNGVPASPTIRASGNVSSVTKNGTGDYTVNFATAMVDGNYVAAGTVASNINNSSTMPIVKATTQFGTPSLKTTTACTFLLNNYAGGNEDVAEIYLTFHR